MPQRRNHAATVLRMATMGGAECLGLEREIGSLETGKKADVVLLRTDRPHCQPMPGVPAESRIVYSMKAADVDTTIIDGRVVYQNGRFTQMDVKKVMATANTQLERLLGRVPFGARLLAERPHRE